MPTTFRPLSASELATSSPPTPIPRTTTSTRSAITHSRWMGSDFQRIGDGLFEGHRLALGPDLRRFVVIEAFPTRAGFLLTKQAPQAGAAAYLVGAGRGPQSARAQEIAFVACEGGEIVELEHHPRDVPGGGEELNGFDPRSACALEIVEIERHQPQGVNRPAEAELIIQFAIQRHGLLQHQPGVRILLGAEQRTAEPPENPRDPRLVAGLAVQGKRFLKHRSGLSDGRPADHPRKSGIV